MTISHPQNQRGCSRKSNPSCILLLYFYSPLTVIVLRIINRGNQRGKIIYALLIIISDSLLENIMDPEAPVKTTFSLSDLKLYVYGSRQSDQFWIPNTESHSRKPYCLTDVEKFTFNNREDDDQQQNGKSKEPIPNPLYNQTIYKIACGSIHSVVLTTDGRVFTFGCNDEGALGRKGIENIPIQVKIEDPIDLIAAGDNHSLFANSVNGAIYFTGNYNYKRGQKMTNSIFEPTRIYAMEINPNNRNKKIQKLSCGANHSCVLINNRVFCRGEPEASTIGRRMSKRHKVENSLTFNGVNLTDVTDIQCGGYHTVARVEKHKETQYYSWGTNDHGQLGIGSFQSQAYPTQIKKLRGKDIKKIAAGASFTLFLSAEGELYGCGNNEDSNLGLGKQYEVPQSQKESGSEDEQKLQQKGEKNFQANKPVSQPSVVGPVPAANQDTVKPNQMSMEPENKDSEMKNQIKQSHEEQKQKQQISKAAYIKSIVKIQLPQMVDNVAAGDNFGLAWNKTDLYTWGMGYGYVLLNGQENDEEEPFKVKSKIINNHTIFELDAGNQHVLYTSYPGTIKDKVKVQPKPSVWQNLSIAKHGLKRRK